jgi:pimeloyl-ACP methyl ester carboxylesterase
VKIIPLEFTSFKQHCECAVFLPEDFQKDTVLPTIVLIPGSTGYKLPSSHEALQSETSNMLVQIAERLTVNGSLIFAYNGRGQGKSEGIRTSQVETLEDADAAIEFLIHNVANIDTTRLALFGPSIGGSGVFHLCSKLPFIKSAIVWGTLPSWTLAKDDGRLNASIEWTWKKGRKNKNFLEFVKEFKTIDPINWLSNVRQPVMVSGGSEDRDFFRQDEQDILLRALSNSSRVAFIKLMGMPHILLPQQPIFKSYVEILAGWYKTTV